MVELVAAMGGADCEALRAGWLAQPANAVSSLSYAVAGAWLLSRGRRAAAGTIGGAARILLATAGGLVAVGLGSFAYHGPQPGWAAAAHDGAIAALVLAFAAQAVALVRRPGSRRGLPALLGAWRTGAIWMVPAVGAYITGRTGSAFCDPQSLWQPHAAWHGLSAVALGLAARGREPVRP